MCRKRNDTLHSVEFSFAAMHKSGNRFESERLIGIIFRFYPNNLSY